VVLTTGRQVVGSDGHPAKDPVPSHRLATLERDSHSVPAHFGAGLAHAVRAHADTVGDHAGTDGVPAVVAGDPAGREGVSRHRHALSVHVARRVGDRPVWNT